VQYPHIISRMRERRAEVDTLRATVLELSPDLLPDDKEGLLLWALEVASSRAIGETDTNGTAATMVAPVARRRAVLAHLSEHGDVPGLTFRFAGMCGDGAARAARAGPDGAYACVCVCGWMGAGAVARHVQP
jgi:hypothetical protein